MRIRWRDFELPSDVLRDEAASNDTYGKYTIEPFERGFGHTIGNGLRRVLLGSIEGTAVTSLEIDGIEHEFKSMDGILEDVTEIVLACKRLRIMVETEATVVLTISAQGECVVTAADIECPTGVTIKNPELKLATLTAASSSFVATMTVRRGRGYVAADETGEPMDQIGLIPLDAAYSPVTRVRYGIEATRVGKFTNYDRLVLEIWTDGTVSPDLALVEAAKIYRKHLNPFVHFSEVVHGVPVSEEVRTVDAAAERRRERMNSLLAESTDRLELSTRARNCLEVAQIRTLGDLVFLNTDELLAIKNLGQTVLKEIEAKLSEIELGVGMDRETVFGDAN
ncbi:MAG: DNA-directed RNA polymerase subunit alpha [Planctomycetes bacterium]|jgi:DNA-directed RNA polymerase subunit alpha|nr:DNA-directed RNA polymerase subunit alpha [Planctomycetota bacterium]MBT4028285.1 DNA-directed RNA polymerase subunit alpha [Planctomycetota bacterium]MBT4560922.1 DNA-directed RNA polymerase subunit alpha [Planctomycetota bacterium]MBT5101113.1 DNA-directed RNA polymerase subunit alpha [Planctomycetota bacterium]MBT5119609.1 DNA-directed RNA polymerase subunit alpha [Planctomycetota bacterium]